MKRFFSNPFALILIGIMALDAITSGQYDSPMDWLMSTLMYLPGIIIGLAFHEFGHAAAATMCGDNTPKRMGRLTLNPFAHVDVVGLIALVFIGFGWGKPVMVNPYNFKKRRMNGFFVSVAGVIMNLLLAFAFAGIWRVLAEFQLDFMLTEKGEIVSQLIFNVIWINLVLMIFNLIPVPPLDGFGIITEIFNLRGTRFYDTVYHYGFVILMALILFNITGKILSPAVSWCYQTVVGLFFGL